MNPTEPMNELLFEKPERRRQRRVRVFKSGNRDDRLERKAYRRALQMARLNDYEEDNC